MRMEVGGGMERRLLLTAKLKKYPRRNNIYTSSAVIAMDEFLRGEYLQYRGLNIGFIDLMHRN